jgi:RHS repeat-associated protein
MNTMAASFTRRHLQRRCSRISTSRPNRLSNVPRTFEIRFVNQIQIRLSTFFTNSDSDNANRASFDIDQDSKVAATTDALLILRHLRGKLGQELTNDAVNPSGNRSISTSDTGSTLITKTQAVQAYLQSLCSDQPNGETVTYFHNDLVGSPVAATNSAGAILWRESYRAYGDRLTQSDAATQRNSLYFGNKRAESLKAGATMSYFGARYYDPTLGRFLSVDPVHFKESNIHSFNRYAYANNNPYRFVDPLGLEGECQHTKDCGSDGAYGENNKSFLEKVGEFFAEPHMQAAFAAIELQGTVGGVPGSLSSTRTSTSVISLSRAKFPESTAHIADAIGAGQPSVLSIDRAGASARRAEALKGTRTASGLDRDEYPPAMFREGGAGSSVRLISPSDNRGAGACIGAQCRGLRDGERIKIKLIE